MSVRVLPVVPGVVLQRLELLSCSYVVTRPEGLVLVDCGFDPAGADALVREGDLVAGAFRVLETPGHEASHVAYLLEPEGVLFCGDAAAVEGRG